MNPLPRVRNIQAFDFKIFGMQAFGVKFFGMRALQVWKCYEV